MIRRGSTRSAPARHPETGAIAVLAAVIFVAVGSFVALSLNVALKMSAKVQLQTAFDGAALAGVMSLNGSEQGLCDASTTALRVAGMHALDAASVQIAGSDAVAGYWDVGTLSFFNTGDTILVGDNAIALDPATTPMYYNAVQVMGGAGDAEGHNSALEVVLGNFLGGAKTMQVKAGATALGGGPCSDDCTLPLVVPSCSLLDNSGALACGQTVTLYFNHGHGKDIAFADMNQPSAQPTPESVISQNQGAQTCGGPPAGVGDNVRLSNGDFFDNHVESSFYGPDASMVCSAGPPYAGCPRRQLGVVNMGSNCDSPMVARYALVGFAQIVIVGTRSTPGSERSIDVYVDCTGQSSAPSGCANFGFSSRKTRLVH